MFVSTGHSANAAASGSPRRGALLWLGLGAVVGLGLLLLVVRSFPLDGAGDLPVLGTLPPFTLTASDGRTVSADDLRGQIWIADFIFTRCPSQCPMLTAAMARLQQALPADAAGAVRLVSFSVDPTYDTPEVLRIYGERFGADSTRWTFLTGEREALYGLIRDGFHLAVAEEAGSAGMITHSDRFILVDRALRIRGYYSGGDAEAQARLVHDAGRLRAAS